MNSIISTNRNIIEAHRLLRDMITTVRQGSLKSKVRPEKIPVILNDKLTRAIS